MKLTVVALLAASLVSAQNFDGIPECAQGCLKESIPDAGCKITDTACQCTESTQTKLRTLVAPCLLRECSASDLLKAQSAGAAACEAYSSASRTATDQGTAGTMSILPTDILPPVSSPSTPGSPSVTTLAPTASPPSGNTTVTRTTTGSDSNETGGSSSGGGNGDNTSETTTGSPDAAPMATAGLVAALLAAAVAI